MDATKAEIFFLGSIDAGKIPFPGKGILQLQIYNEKPGNSLFSSSHQKNVSGSVNLKGI